MLPRQRRLLDDDSEQREDFMTEGRCPWLGFARPRQPTPSVPRPRSSGRHAWRFSSSSHSSYKRQLHRAETVRPTKHDEQEGKGSLHYQVSLTIGAGQPGPRAGCTAVAHPIWVVGDKGVAALLPYTPMSSRARAPVPESGLLARQSCSADAQVKSTARRRYTSPHRRL